MCTSTECTVPLILEVYSVDVHMEPTMCTSTECTVPLILEVNSVDVHIVGSHDVHIY